MTVVPFTFSLPAEANDEIYGSAVEVPNTFSPLTGSVVYDGEDTIYVAGVRNENLSVGFYPPTTAYVWVVETDQEIVPRPYGGRGYCGSVYVPSVETADHMLHVFIDVAHPFFIEEI